jgi:uncharacterized membrane protein
MQCAPMTRTNTRPHQLPATLARLIAAFLLCCACSAAGAAQELHRGTYVEVDGAAFFEPCGKSHRYKVEGDSAATELSAIYAALVGNPKGNPAGKADGGLYVELRGQLRPRGALLVRGLERATNEGLGCREVLRKSLFKALGGEPSWHLFIDDTGLRWRTLSDGVVVAFPYRPMQRSDDTLIFDSRNASAAIHVELRRIRCVEPASGGHYSYEARVKVGDRQYRGCAYPGSQFRDGRL